MPARELLLIFLNRKMFVLLVMGFSSGLPLALTGSTLQAWMKESGFDLKTIGIFSLIGLPYTIKFLWAPLLDLINIPVLGKRRGWICISQISLCFLIYTLSISSTQGNTYLIALIALLIAFFSATQDIAVDAYRAEILAEHERGPGASISNLGYRLAMITSGAIALILAEHLSWSQVYNIMALIILLSTLIHVLATEPIPSGLKPKNIQDAVIIPLKDFFLRRHSLEVLLFILIYKIDIVMAVALTTPFMIEIGFSKSEIGAISKGVGMIASIAGSLVGGALYPKLGLKKSLLYFGIIQGFSTLSFALLAIVGHNSYVMAFAVGFENFCAGLATTPFIALLMSYCNPGFAATSFALLSSFSAISRVFAGAPTGWLVDAVGWIYFFIFCALSAIPGIILLIKRYDSWMIDQK